MKIGLTGGIGSGKSTVARLFSDLGVPVISADDVSRDLTQRGQPAWQALLDDLGDAFFTADGDLDRRALRDAMFRNPAIKARMEAILHPLILSAIDQWSVAQTHPYQIIEIPLLVEADSAITVDRVLVVDLPEDLQKSRAMSRDHASAADIEAILATQASRRQRLDAADDVIDNSGDLDALKQAVTALHQQYLQDSSSKQLR